MNTSDNKVTLVTRVCREIGELLDAIGTLFNGANKFITGGVVLMATLLGLLLIKPDPIPSPPVPVPPSPVPPVQSNAFDVGGTWRDDQNNALNLVQDGSTIHFNSTGNSDGFTYELTGSGVLADQSVHLNLDCRSFGQSIGQMPADITFVNSHKAILSMTLMGVPISGTLHR